MIKVLEKITNIIFTVSGMVYMFFSYIEPDKALSMNYITIALLCLILTKK